MAGGGRAGRELLVEQHVQVCRAEGSSEREIEESLRTKEALFDLLVDAEVRIRQDPGSKETVLERLRPSLAEVFWEEWRALSENVPGG
jgi:hypothetical protein